MKTVEYTLNGQTYHLCLNGAALFDIYDKYGNKSFVTDHIRGTGKKSFSATCWMLAKLAEQGELVRRYQGHDHGKFPTEQMFQVMLKPLQVQEAKAAIGATVALGFAREEEENGGELDLGLVELKKKRQ